MKNIIHFNSKSRWFPAREKRSGFSLVEVTIALGVVTFAAVSILGLLPTGLVVMRDAMNQTVESLLLYHKYFQRYGVRFKPELPVKLTENIVQINVPSGYYKDLSRKAKSILGVERVLTQLRMESIVAGLRTGDVIYTNYTTGIIPMVKQYIEGRSMSFAVYTGDEKVRLKEFLKGAVDVLICSRAISHGIDGLQKKANRIFIICPMWTSTEYDQFVGRFNRQGSAFKEVEVFIPQLIEAGSAAGYNWDYLRWLRIYRKRDLLNGVLDGNLPERIHVNKKRFFQEFRNAIGLGQLTEDTEIVA